MTIYELRKLVEKGEGQHLEFKKKADHPDKIVREMVAFANSVGGGVLLLGVEDNGRITGLPFPEEDQFVMEAAIARYARPLLEYQLTFVPIGQGKTVLFYQIPEGGSKPYAWLSDKENQKFSVFVRSKDQSLRASYEMFRILLNKGESSPVSFGSVESLLFSHLGKNEKVSIREFVSLAGIGRKRVSSLFISLCCRGVLEIEPGENYDLFRLSRAYLNA